MTRRSGALGAVLAVLLVVTSVSAWRWMANATDVVRVEPGTSVTRAAATHPGAVIVLAPGTHEPFELRAPATVQAEPGAVIRGGSSGVLVRDTDGVVLDGLVVVGAELHGIEVVDASAAVRRCRIDVAARFAQGIEVRNANSRPRSSVRDCVVTGGQEGIVSHVSRVEIVDNVVHGTTMRAIAVTEMSEGLVQRNRVLDVAGVGLFCGDMSHCELRDNDVRGVADGGRGSRSHSGHGAAAAYHSTMRLRGNDFASTAASPVGVYTGSITTSRFPLSVWPPGWRGGLAAIPITIGAVAGLAVLRLGAQAVLGWWERRRGARRARPVRTTASLAVLALGGFAVQSFHMVEHVVQVWQVQVAEAEVRSGLVGARADVEWVHWIFNVLVLGFLLQLWRLGRSGGWLDGHRGAAPWMLAAVALQGAHLVEHTAKLAQHLSLRIDPAPGIVGRAVDLVWLHFAVNTAVWVGTAVAVVSLVRHLLARRSASGHARLAWSREPEPGRLATS